MLRDEAVARIQEGCGFRSDRAATIISRLQEEQRELERGKTLPPFLRVITPLTLTINTGAITLPADFLRRTEDPLGYTPEDTSGPSWRTIPWRDGSAVRYEQPTDTGAPEVASISLIDGVIYFNRNSNVTRLIYFIYYAKADLLTSNIENLWLEHAPDLLIGGAGLRYARDIRNKEAISLFGEMYKQQRLTWFAEAINADLQEQGDMFLGANN